MANRSIFRDINRDAKRPLHHAVNNGEVSAYQALAQSTSCVAHWIFADNAEDQTANSNHGAENGTITYGTHGIANVPGKFVQTSSGNYLTLPQVFSGLSAFTLAGWVRFDAVQTGASPFFGSFTAGSAPLLRESGGGGKWQVYAYTPASAALIADLQSTISIAATTWLHIALTYNGSTAKLYSDGVDVSSGGTIAAGTFGNDSSGVRVGGGASGLVQPFSGRTADLFVFDTVLTQEQINVLRAGDA